MKLIQLLKEIKVNKPNQVKAIRFYQTDPNDPYNTLTYYEEDFQDGEESFDDFVYRLKNDPNERELLYQEQNEDNYIWGEEVKYFIFSQSAG